VIARGVAPPAPAPLPLHVATSDAVDANVLKALAHPLRMRMLTLVAERGEASPVEMSRALDQPLATVSHHARVLRDSGCIELSRTEPRRGAVEHYYRATAAPFSVTSSGSCSLPPRVVACQRSCSGRSSRRLPRPVSTVGSMPRGPILRG
jgi:DNA-binding transcriptional ArsR family regulator